MNKVIIEVSEDHYKALLNTGLLIPSDLKEIKIDDSFLKERRG